MIALRKPVSGMSVAEFLAWEPGTPARRWQLRDGEPEMMAPASDAHGTIQGELAFLLISHLRGRDSPCRVVVTPGVIPRVRFAQNFLIPDLGITSTPSAGGTAIPDPVVLIEILSPSNERETRANVCAFTTIPSVREIVLIRSTSIAAELWRRGPDGSWQEQAEFIGPDDDLALETVSFHVALRAAYRSTALSPT